jgi:RimJ/RimL family protein N-acetyltransferase
MRVLQTDRLTLRWFDERDAAFILELVNDPSWIANIGDRGVRTLDDARAWIAEKLVSSYWDKGHGLWAIERRSDGERLGMCGLLERDSLPAVDVGYALAPRFWGNGYAREATAASLEYAREVLGKRRILAIVQPENRTSIRVLESVGMVRVGSHRVEGEEHELALFAVGDEPADAEAIDAIVRRFFAAFSNRDAMSRIASVPSFFLPDAVVTIVTPTAARAVETSSVRDFVAPRASLLLDGRLTSFEEHEVSAQTEVVGAIAHRSSRYEKAGTLDGVPFEGAGNKHFQLVKTVRGWKIVALAWEEVGGSQPSRTP